MDKTTYSSSKNISQSAFTKLTITKPISLTSICNFTQTEESSKVKERIKEIEKEGLKVQGLYKYFNVVVKDEGGEKEQRSNVNKEFLGINKAKNDLKRSIRQKLKIFKTTEEKEKAPSTNLEDILSICNDLDGKFNNFYASVGLLIAKWISNSILSQIESSPASPKSNFVVPEKKPKLMLNSMSKNSFQSNRSRYASPSESDNSLPRICSPRSMKLMNFGGRAGSISSPRIQVSQNYDFECVNTPIKLGGFFRPSLNSREDSDKNRTSSIAPDATKLIEQFEKSRNKIRKLSKKCLRSQKNLNMKEAVIKDLEDKFSALKSFTGRLQEKIQTHTPRNLEVSPHEKARIGSLDLNHRALQPSAFGTINSPHKKQKSDLISLKQTKEITLENLDKLDSASIKRTNKSLCKTLRSPLTSVTFSANHTIDFEPFSEGILRCLKLVQSKVVLQGFKITEKELKEILQASSRAKDISLIYCKIEVTKQFRLSSKLKYNCENLNLEFTVKVMRKEYLDETKTVYFFAALSKVMKSLQKVKVIERHCPSEELQKLLDKLGFLASVEKVEG